MKMWRGQVWQGGLSLAVAFCCLVGAPVMVAAEAQALVLDAQAGPKAHIESTIDEVVKIVESLPAPTDAATRREKLRVLINPRFDFAEMAKRSLGAQWSKCSTQEQEEFVRVFSDLLAKTYISRVEMVRTGMVKIESEKVEEPKAIVRTTVTHKGDEFPIEYKLLHVDNTWRVYDVIIENIGLVANYRNEFAGIIRKDNFDGLMKRLREKAQG